MEAPRFAWETLGEEELLDVRLRELGLRIEGTWLEPAIEKLHRELARRHLAIRPYAWLSTQWFVPRGATGIAIPFYLAHPRLMQLERKKMRDVEGGTKVELMKILRHESGHVLDNAFVLGRDARVRALFGKWTTRYPKQYRPNPASRRFVQHLRLYYAQAHPHEDFAETFAVVLGARRATWQKQYFDWPALEKLEFVDALLRELRDRKPRRRKKVQTEAIGTLDMTLREYYEKKQSQYDVSFPTTWDGDLKRLFSDDPRDRQHELASRFLRRNRAEIRGLVSNFTGEFQYTREQVFHDLIGRSRELKLRAAGPESRLKMEFAILLTVTTMDVHYRRRNTFAL
ncbi:MAG: putative zinc-binding metallopeptidase [Acidobacteria bacterium]|nr:putative zinc-binding metallopeptidase [Acidobacteriota bacterium]MBV9474950.1 putative zinc-binding metallopeptidase [Acidobacteriota bacterium]